ncbi:MAG: glycosyltransferase [Firmicutes bacterium]|nr:glycosyltransferase [Bacillota bacterium]
MRVLQINVVSNWGSTGRIAEEIGAKILDKGGVSYIAYSRGRSISSSRLIRIGNTIDMFYHGMMTRIFDLHGLSSTSATERFVRTIQQVRPDIIHLHNIHGYYLNYSILFSFLQNTNIPVVWTIHDCWPFTGHCTYFSSCGCMKWETQCCKCPQKNSYPQSLLFDRSKENYLDKKRWFTSLGDRLTLVPVSDWLSNTIHKSFLKDCNQYRIYNGIDTDVFHPIDDAKCLIKDKYKIKQDKIVLGVSNIWNERKGINDFIKLRSLLSDEYVILLIGLNKSQISSLPKGMIGIERTDNVSQLVDIYSAADIYVNFSKEETFGLTTVEAMSCGTPVLVYNSTALPEIVSENTGVIVPLGDVYQAAKEIIHICHADKSEYTLACRDRAIAKFNKLISVAEYFNLYESILHNRK